MKASPMLASTASPLTSGAGTNDGATPAAIASWPTPMPATLHTSAGIVAFDPDSRRLSATPTRSPIASVGPHPIA